MFIPSVFFFGFLYLMSFLLVISSEDWFLIWVGLEINMMTFLIMVYRRWSMKVIEVCMKYFFIQSLGSAFLIGILYLGWSMVGGLSFMILSYKIGAGPFFYWFPNMCSGLDWGSCFMLMLFQKMLPLCLIFMFVHWVMWIVMLISLMVGIMGSFNQNNVKELLGYSSIHHLGWILIISISKNLMWFIYLIVYGMVMLGVLINFYKNKIVNFFMMYKCKNKMWLIVGMLSMAGMPPLLGFLLKWMALINIMNLGLLYVMVLIMVSLVMLYVYMQIMYDMMLGSSDEISWFSKMKLYEYMVDIVGMMGMVMGISFMFFMFM
uniref:NADH-ubiquinone oxidoreductase chain 2 n=1 Tax=Telamonia vlijmi TaxID=1112492 RepID=A0A060D3Q5_TELVL|nr:NADH dehydrogenase subunit 2 [Telamonia vlijmi]AIB04190.1 NADH dehydrogenase subunit 2 [Telamonia vlijmi]